MNFSWMLPYTRTLFNSEIVSSLFLFGTFFLYEIKKDKSPGWLFLLLIGFLFGLSFYFRFQMGFAIAGFGLWMLFVEKKYSRILPIAAGFTIAVLINTYLDYRLYGEWSFIPYEYFYTNINEGRAAQFSTSSFLRYIGLLIAVITAPPLSLILFYYGCKAIVKKHRQPVCIAVFLFIVIHCLVGHKEERFLSRYSMPYLSLLDLVSHTCLSFMMQMQEMGRLLIKTALVITIVLNTAVLILFAAIPYSQSVYFTSQLKNKFSGRPATIFYLLRSPYTTPGGSPLVFYKKEAENLS
jgi:phosphatidylinositol glycan class B